MKDKCKRCKHYDKTQVLTFTCTDECPNPKPITGTADDLDIDKIVESALHFPTTRDSIFNEPLTVETPYIKDLMSEKKASEHRDLHEKVLSGKPTRIYGVLQPTQYTSVCFYCGNQENILAMQKEHAVQDFYDRGWRVKLGRMTCPECINSKDFSKMKKKKLGRE